jgi:DNA-binding MarR family transcriptional regulator
MSVDQPSPCADEPATAEKSAAEKSAAEKSATEDPGREWNLPWAEPFQATDPARAELAATFAGAIRKTGSLLQLMGTAAADRIGINATDLNCLNILSFKGQMTAGELARETGLTTASITGVVDRLEEAGYVRRERDPRDRRRVVIRLVLDRAMRDVASVFRPMMRDWQQMAARYSDDELRLIVDFYGRMEEVLRGHLTRLREPLPREPAGELDREAAGEANQEPTTPAG